MKLELSPDGNIAFRSALVSLSQICPVVNGAVHEQIRPGVEAEPAGTVRLRYPIPAVGLFGIEILTEDDRYAIRYWLDDLPAGFQLDSFGLYVGRVENVRSYLRSGYYSWDGSFYVDLEGLSRIPSAPLQENGYAMTQLLPFFSTGSVIVGFDRHDRFQHTFAFHPRQQPMGMTIQTLWDRNDHRGLPRCTSERLLIFEHPGVDDALRTWAQYVADASPRPPRLSTPPIKGWCSWYNLYAAITEENILDHLRDVVTITQRECLPMRVFQIDDGFTPEMGDWLDVKPQFPRGMKALLDDIRAAGFTPGLWIAPFMVGNRSHLYRDHPDWVVRDRLTGGPLAHMRFYGEFRWHKRSEEYYILDVTHPQAYEYLRHVFHTWRYEWGCEYFKTDFMHFGSEYGPDRAVWYERGLTRIEIWRRTAEMIRAEIGDAVWLGCGCPLWASVGLVDAVRIGGDVGAEWKNGYSAQALLRNHEARNFCNHILWQADPDCILLREDFHHLTEAEIRALAIYAGMIGGLVMTSDALSILSEERLRLWKLVLQGLSPALRTESNSVCRFPLLGQSPIVYRPSPGEKAVEAYPIDPVIVQVRTSSGQDGAGVIFLFNSGDVPVQRWYPLKMLGFTSPLYAYDWTRQLASAERVDKIIGDLPAHDGVLIFLSAVKFS